MRPRQPAGIPDGAAAMTHRDLDALLRQLVVLGALAVLLVPAARGSSAWLGWLPLWLLGMPLAAWWSLRRFPLPALAVRLPRRRRAQATRRPSRRVQAGAGPLARRA
jgi:hypothetical protein